MTTVLGQAGKGCRVEEKVRSTMACVVTYAPSAVISGFAALSCGKALPFRAFTIQLLAFRRGYASPVEAQPQPTNKI